MKVKNPTKKVLIISLNFTNMNSLVVACFMENNAMKSMLKGREKDT